MPDLIVRGGTAVLPDGLRRVDIAVEHGRIAAIGTDVGSARETIDAGGLVVLPGLIDVHVHFNEPGRTEWEGAATGSRALAAGGGTLFFDMPLNSTPCVVNEREVEHKRAALEAGSILDFGIWGGLVPGAIPEMAPMAAHGVIGFKAFMCDSGLPEFPRADDATLLGGLREAAKLRLPVAVHAENEELTRAHQPAPDASAVRAFLASRPVVAESDAIQRALLFAAETGAALHIVHVSTGRGVTLAAEARARGVDVSIETCPHYLYFTDDDVERLGAVVKCAPPLRSARDAAALWDELLTGHVDIVGSDHSPTEPSRKASDFTRAWGGIAGGQSTLSVLIDRGHHARGLSLERIVDLISARPARRFRVARKGALVEGYDADLTIVDPDRSYTLRAEDLHQRHSASPYVGRTFRGVVRRTIRRGETIFLDGRITAALGGVFIRPEPVELTA